MSTAGAVGRWSSKDRTIAELAATSIRLSKNHKRKDTSGSSSEKGSTIREKAGA
jgi:hypothetical protein